MKDKLKIVVVIVVAILIFVLTRACSNYFMGRIREDIKNETKETAKIINNEYLIKYRDDWEIIINFFLRGLISYDEMPLSEKFVKKYPVLDKIIKGQCTGESTDSIFDEYDKNSNIMTIRYKTGKGYEQIAYQLHYTINENNELDDIEILDSRVYEDENGSYPHYDKFHYYYDNPVTATDILCFPYRNDFDGNPYRIYVTDAFDKKFPNAQDDTNLNDGIVGDDDYLICGEVIQDKEYPNICYVEFLDVDYTKTYKITFEILDDGYINDAEIELYKKEITKDPEYVKKMYEGYKENVRWF